MDSIALAAEAVKYEFPNIIFKPDEPLKHYTTFKIGGPVSVMFFPENTAGLVGICNILKKKSISPLILGNGSNILASDKKLDLIVINTTKLNGISLKNAEDSGNQGYFDIAADAGVLLSKLAVFAYENELTGLEFAHGIPGTVGGAVVMNAGAYGGEMKDVVFGTTGYSIGTGEYVLTAAENEFSYRHSRFLETGDVVLSAVLRLKKGDKEDIKRKMDDLSNRRKKSQPLELPSGGSTFKRPKEGYAAALIEQAGLRGYTIGDAQVSDKHTGFIVNKGNATFSDVTAVVEHVKSEVFKQFGIQLETEIKVVR